MRLVKGWFKDTVPAAPIERIAVLRLDGDLYESTIQVLEGFYPRLSPGGFCIIDDYGAMRSCRPAVEDFRRDKRITALRSISTAKECSGTSLTQLECLRGHDAATPISGRGLSANVASCHGGAVMRFGVSCIWLVFVCSGDGRFRWTVCQELSVRTFEMLVPATNVTTNERVDGIRRHYCESAAVF